MSSKFDAYEIIGVITPGSVLLFGLAIFFDELHRLFFAQGFSVGDLGLFVILSFVSGQLVQGIGNIVEFVVWKALGGRPTDWLLEKPNKLLHESQVDRFQATITELTGCDVEKIKISERPPIVREMYLAVQEKGETGRIDSFNRTYGLMRGLTAALVSLSLIAIVTEWPDWKPTALLLLASFVSVYRMVRFGEHYGRELVVSYLRISN